MFSEPFALPLLCHYFKLLDNSLQSGLSNANALALAAVDVNVGLVWILMLSLCCRWGLLL